jgi:hypothetical protein
LTISSAMARLILESCACLLQVVIAQVASRFLLKVGELCPGLSHIEERQPAAGFWRRPGSLKTISGIEAVTRRNFPSRHFPTSRMSFDMERTRRRAGLFLTCGVMARLRFLTIFLLKADFGWNHRDLCAFGVLARKVRPNVRGILASADRLRRDAIAPCKAGLCRGAAGFAGSALASFLARCLRHTR